MKWIKLALLFLALGLIGFYFVSNKPHDNMSKLKTAYSLSATELYESFENDEDKANTLYLDKVIEVTGVISEINKKEDRTTIYLETGGMMGGIACEMDPLSEQKTDDLKTEGTTTLKCKCTGYLSDVVLIRCVRL